MVGLQESEGRWIPHLNLDKCEVMDLWRFAVIVYLWRALHAGVLRSGVTDEKLKILLKAQYRRRWNTHIDYFRSKKQFLRYAGRYIRRPPIDESRFVSVTDEGVQFRNADLKEKRVVITRYSREKFVALLAEHVRDRYQHAMRYFGLLARVSKRKTSAALFALLRQKKRRPPKRLSWRNSILKDFGRDPLVDTRGQAMRWVRRLKPANTNSSSFS
jgi:hypothetical protein